jgi:predicted ATPase/DNA-binding winged helix-turn-helix (wHTH) protein
MGVRSGSQRLDAKEPRRATAAYAQAVGGWGRIAVPSDAGQRHSRPDQRDPTFSFGPFRLIPARQLLLRNGVPVRLGSRALTILTALVERRGELVTRDELMAAAWPKLFVHESNLKVNMANLRHSLGDAQKEPTYVATVIGRGYRFVASVEIEASANSQRNAELESTEISGLPPAREIVGRDEEIARIVTELRERQHVTVVGAGGIGKTTVAIAAAQALGAEYSDGVCFVDLSTFDDPTLLPSALAAALGIRGNPDDILTAVIGHLEQRQMLVLLDNCEHVLPAAAIFARRFCASVGRFRLLATSRQSLGTFAEHVIRLDSLRVPDAVDGLTIEEAMRFPALDLFARRAAEWAGYELVESDCAAVAQICRSLDGIPLAIELAAANVADHTAAALCAMLDEHPSFQNRHIEGQPARHETLLATIDWSYKLLPQNEAAILRIVSLFAAAFEPVEVAAVAEPTAIGPVDVTICLGSLVAKSLLKAEVSGAGLRYRLLDSTRRYALERLREDPMESDVRLRHAEHTLAIFEQSEREWDRHETDGWTGRYLDRLPDLQAALTWAFGSGRCPELGVHLVKASLPFWFSIALLSEALTRVDEALKQAESTLPDLLKTKLACSRAWILMFSGTHIPQTEDAWLAAVSLARRAGDVGYQLHALVGLAFHSMNSGHLAEAAKWLDEFRELSSRHQNWSAAQDGERLLAWSKLHTGELAESRQILDRMAAVYPRPNTETLLASFQIDPYVGTRCYLPLCAWLMGQRDYAATVAREAVDAAGEARHLFAQSHALTVAALTVAFFNGDSKALAAHLAQLQSIHRQTTPGIWIHATQFFTAVLKDLRGDPSAVDDLQAAIRSIMDTKYRLRIGIWFGTLADALARQGRIVEASGVIDEAIQYQVQQGERWCRSELLRIKASILRRTSQHAAMEAMLRDALQEARAIGALSFEIRAANDLAAYYLDLSRRDDAAHVLLPVFRRFSEGFGTKDLVVASQLLERMGVAARADDRALLG